MHRTIDFYLLLSSSHFSHLHSYSHSTIRVYDLSSCDFSHVSISRFFSHFLASKVISPQVRAVVKSFLLNEESYGYGRARLLYVARICGRCTRLAELNIRFYFIIHIILYIHNIYIILLYIYLLYTYICMYLYIIFIILTWILSQDIPLSLVII